jgi:ubiquitin carboxyl-terminal hydrolase 4/11/15
VTSAAYLLFYRRRSSAPLGGPRFREIFDKFDNPNDDDDDDDSATESGDDQRQGGGGFFLNGSSNGGIGAGAARLQTERGSKTTVTPVADLDDDEPPSYGSGDGGSTVQLSIEDEGVEMSDNFNSQHSNPLTQAWSFDGVTSNARAGSTGAEYASDDAQLNSSDEERGRGKELYDQDIDMVSNVADAESDAGGPPPPDDNAQIALSDIQNEAWERKGVLSVPAKAGSDRDSDEVAEIHVEGDKTARPE